MIVSVSRRCDIPRFRFGWFMDRLAEGFVDVANPFNAAQIRRVSLLPRDVDAIVFWTRDPQPILDHAAELAAHAPFYVMVTLTGYPPLLEPNPVPRDAVIHAMKTLAEQLGSERVIWRYDPVLLSSITDSEFHIANFTALAGALAGSVKRVIVSIYDEYKSSGRRLAALEKKGGFRMFPHYESQGGLLNVPTKMLLTGLAHIAHEKGMEIQSCAEAENLSGLGIKAGPCIDSGLITTLSARKGSGFPGRAPDSLFDGFSKDRNQRPHCLCAASVDIGSYGPCPALCVYCYARR